MAKNYEKYIFHNDPIFVTIYGRVIYRKAVQNYDAGMGT